MRNRPFFTLLVTAVAAVWVDGLSMGQVHDLTTLPAAHAPAAPWSRLVQLSGHGAIGSPGGTHPLALDKTVYAAWVQNGLIYLCTSHDDGANWDHATRVTAHGTALYPCSLELCGSVLQVVWPDTRHHGLAEAAFDRLKAVHHDRKRNGTCSQIVIGGWCGARP